MADSSAVMFMTKLRANHSSGMVYGLPPLIAHAVCVSGLRP